MENVWWDKYKPQVGYSNKLACTQLFTSTKLCVGKRFSKKMSDRWTAIKHHKLAVLAAELLLTCDLTEICLHVFNIPPKLLDFYKSLLPSSE